MVWDLILTRGSQVQFLSKNLTATCKLYAWLEMHQHRGWVSLHRSLSHWWFMVKLNLFKKGSESGQDSLFATGNSKQQIGLKPFIPQHKRRRGGMSFCCGCGHLHWDCFYLISLVDMVGLGCVPIQAGHTSFRSDSFTFLNNMMDLAFCNMPLG